jgi:hypothetical protein
MASPNPLQLYDQFATTWERVRANIFSHAIGAGLLWFVGFVPPRPSIDAVQKVLHQNQVYQALGDAVGSNALLSVFITLMIALYVITLKEAGRILGSAALIILPSFSWLGLFEKALTPELLFYCAATLEPGTYKPLDLKWRISELVFEYSLGQPAAFKEILDRDQTRQQDAGTYFANATVFLVAWILSLRLLPTASPLALSIKSVYWSGLAALAFYFLITRARVFDASRSISIQLAQAASALIRNDSFYADRLAAARSNPKPYRELLDCFLELKEEPDNKPSLKAYLKARLGLLQVKTDQGSNAKISEDSSWMKFRLYARQAERPDYKDPHWLLKYGSWILIFRLGVIIRGLSDNVLRMFGLRRRY